MIEFVTLNRSCFLALLIGLEVVDSAVTAGAREESASCKKDILIKFWADTVSYEEGREESEA